MSGEEMAHYLSKKVERDAEREKAGYSKRAIAARKNAKKLGGGKDFRLVSAIDATTFLRHEIQTRAVCLIQNIAETSQNRTPKR